MVCRPDEQKRFTVAPETVTGGPARIAAMRATLWPVVPSGAAQPRITSSISPSSILARSAACLMTCAAMSAACVSLKIPRNALPIGVRAVETMTASAMKFPPDRNGYSVIPRGSEGSMLMAFNPSLRSG